MDLRRLTNGQGSNTAPSWTPDGSGILFVSTRDVINGEVYRMNLDGGNVRRLTRDSLVKDSPAMTPDGGTIMVTVNIRERFSLAAYPSSGGPPVHLTSASFNSWQPRIHSDGKSVLFLANRSDTVDVFVLNLNRPDVIKRLTRDNQVESGAAWAGDDNHILVARAGAIVMTALREEKTSVLSFRGDGAPDWWPNSGLNH
jgi:TolB protein